MTTIAKWTVTCPKHGDVSDVSLTMKLERDGKVVFDRGYCLECVGEAFDRLEIPQVRGEWK